MHATTRPEEVGLSSDRLDRFGMVLGEEIARGALPGAVVLIARRGRVAFVGSYGVRDPAGSEPMSADTIFRLYSMGKPIVSLAAMLLVEVGKLLLADPLAHVLPEFANPQVAFETAVTGAGDLELRPATRLVTIHDLLRQTSGYPYDFMLKGKLQQRYRAAGTSRRDQSLSELASRLASVPLAFEPGTRWRSGHSTDLLGRVIEVVTGQSLGRALEQLVFEPLGMTDTGFFVPPAEQHRLAEPFGKDPVSGAAVSVFAVKDPPQLESGGGGLVSTVNDYARFLTMLANGGAYDGGRLLSRTTIDYMTSDHLGALPRELPPGYGYGLGFAVRGAKGIADMAGSAGEYYWSGVVGTTFFVDPHEEMFAIFMSQIPGQRERLSMLFRNLAYGAIMD